MVFIALFVINITFPIPVPLLFLTEYSRCDSRLCCLPFVRYPIVIFNFSATHIEMAPPWEFSASHCAPKRGFTRSHVRHFTRARRRYSRRIGKLLDLSSRLRGTLLRLLLHCNIMRSYPRVARPEVCMRERLLLPFLFSRQRKSTSNCDRGTN